MGYVSILAIVENFSINVTDVVFFRQGGSLKVFYVTFLLGRVGEVNVYLLPKDV